MTRNTKLSTPNNQVIAPQSTCKSIKHQVSILHHWFIPSLLPLHLVGTSNSDIGDSKGIVDVNSGDRPASFGLTCVDGIVREEMNEAIHRQTPVHMFVP